MTHSGIRTGSGDTVDADPEGAFPFYVRSDAPLLSDKWEFDTIAVLTAGDGAGVAKVFHLVAGRFMAHQRVYVLDNFRRVTPEFFYYAFSNLFHLMALDGSAKSTVDSVRRSMIADMPFAIPSLNEQRAITDYLDGEIARIDTLIKEQQRLIEMLHERRRAVVEEAVATVDTSGMRLKHLIRSIRQGWSPQCCSWPADGVETWAVLKAGAANGGRFRPMENKELPEDEIPRPEIVVAQGDLLVSRANTRELVGSAAVVDGEFPRLMLCDKLYAFTIDKRRADSQFVAAVLGSRRWRDLIELMATGASQSMVNISQSDIVNLPMHLPSVEEQRRLMAYLKRETARIDQLVAETERLIELASERRAALITAAVTGQIDVRATA